MLILHADADISFLRLRLMEEASNLNPDNAEDKFELIATLALMGLLPHDKPKEIIQND